MGKTEARVGPWVLGELLGSGGSGSVFAASDARDARRRAALKVLVAPSDGTLARLERERALLARVDAPSIVKVHEVGRCGPQGRDAYLVMDLVPGQTLRAVLDESTSGLPLERALDLAARIARAIGAAHALGIAHRDLKPENIIITPTGAVRIVDFGLATAQDVERLTRTGAFLGTVGYMAPEQLESKPERQGPATDVFALGAILSELVTGELPTEPGPPLAVLDAVLRGKHTPPSERKKGLPSGLDALVARALAPDPGARFADGAAFAKATEDLSGRGAPAASRAPARARRAIAAIGVVLVLSLGAFFFFRERERSRPAPTPTSSPESPLANVVTTPAPVPSASLTREPSWFRNLDGASRPELSPGIRPLDSPGEYRNERDGSVLVYVTGGRFMLGTDEEDASANQKPAHDVSLSPYFLGKYEVTNEQFRRFVAETGHVTLAEREGAGGVFGWEMNGEARVESTPGATWRKPDGSRGATAPPEVPVVQVSWDDARACATWAGLRLPTEAEWERAARIDGSGHARRFPWGDEVAEEKVANFSSDTLMSKKGALAPATSFARGASATGAFNMSGNAREWVLDQGTPGFYRTLAAQPGALDPCDGGGPAPGHMARGGAFCQSWKAIRTTFRSHVAGSDDATGFRVAISADLSPRPREAR